MSIDFNARDVLHRVAALFRPTTLPTADKPYTLHAANQTELDIHDIASKAEAYNITTPPAVIEEGLTAGFRLMAYLIADGYKLNTPFIDGHMRLPGTYEGTETRLAEGCHAEAAFSASAEFRKYLAECVEVNILGIEDVEGIIGHTLDMATNTPDQCTRGDVLEIHGSGLKIASDQAHAAQVGVYFQDANNRIKCTRIIANNPTMVSVLVPAELTATYAYRVEIDTQSTVRHGSSLLKNVRTVKAGFTVTAQ